MIKQLTPEQQAKIPEYRDRWTAIGRATGPADRKLSEKLVCEAYKAAGLKPPTQFVWCKSPVTGAVEAAKLATGKDKPAKADIMEQFNKACYGQHDADWLSYYSYFLEVCTKEDETEEKELREILLKSKPLIELAKQVGWWWPLEEAVVITERPTSLALDTQGRLHNETAPAVAYGDGKPEYALYFWHGIAVPEDIIEDRDTLTLARINKESNAEVRRAMVSLFGQERYMKEAGMIEVSKDEFGVLYKSKVGDSDIMAVLVNNSTPEPDGSIKQYFLAVHPELRPLLVNGTLGEPQAFTPKNGIASTFGLRGEEYNPDQMS